MFFLSRYISMIEEYQHGIGETADSMTFPREKQGHGLLKTFGNTRDTVYIMCEDELKLIKFCKHSAFHFFAWLVIKETIVIYYYSLIEKRDF